MKHFGMFVHQEIVSLLNVKIRRKTKRGARDKMGIRETSERAKINPVCGLNGLPRRPHRVQL